MTKLKFFLTEKELLENYMEIKELQELWLTNLLNHKFVDCLLYTSDAADD